MAQVRLAAAALYFGTAHAQRIVGGVNNTAFGDGLVKRRPAAAAFKLGIAFKKRVATGKAIISTYLFKPFKLRGPGAFGSFLPGNIVYIFGQYFFSIRRCSALLSMHRCWSTPGSFYPFRSWFSVLWFVPANSFARPVPIHKEEQSVS